jgi:predicted phosphodiesterase
MRTAIIADIHGNAVAFDAVLAALEREPVDQAVCLGDVAQGGPQPAECLQRLHALAGPVVLGNSDAFLLSVDAAANSAEPVTARHLETRTWSLAQLSDELVDYMAGFQRTVEAPLGGDYSLLAFHGSPRSFDELLFPETSDEQFADAVGESDASVLAGGHVHLQWLRRLGDALFLNPGSVGLAYDRSQPEEDFRLDPWAEYAVVTADDSFLGIEFRRLPFDPSGVARATLESGMPHAETRAREWTG